MARMARVKVFAADEIPIVNVIRSRLNHISWWMRLLVQNIAQRANKVDSEVGKFWQARYRAVRLLDETAILACAAYGDLNPIRSAVAETIEDRDFTLAQKRCCDVRTAAGLADPLTRPSGTLSPLKGRGEDARGDGKSRQRSSRHLAPMELRGGSSTTGPFVNERGAR